MLPDEVAGGGDEFARGRPRYRAKKQCSHTRSRYEQCLKVTDALVGAADVSTGSSYVALRQQSARLPSMY